MLIHAIQSDAHSAVATAQVDSFAWVVPADAPTLKVADRSFVFSNSEDATNFFMVVLD